MNDESRRVTLSKAHRNTPAGRELIALLTELSADGQVSREEMDRLRAWLEVDRGIDFPACGFLYEVVDSISSDGAITEEELDTLALAIERVLPTDVRFLAALKRKEHRAARRRDLAAKRAAGRAQERGARIRARELAKPLHRGDFMVMGARRSPERREGCQSLTVGDTVTLEREPDNSHDGNAILVFSHDGTELGYVPREDAKQMAPLLDAGAEVDATVKKLLETADGDVLPVVISLLRRGGTPARSASPSATPAPPSPPLQQTSGSPRVTPPPSPPLRRPLSDPLSPSAETSRPPGRMFSVGSLLVVVLALAVAGYCARAS